MREGFGELIEYFNRKFSDINEKFSDINKRLDSIKEELKEKADKADIKELRTAVDSCASKT
ncbi:MAG: hypothetical protein ABIF89_00735 [bacterium]